MLTAIFFRELLMSCRYPQANNGLIINPIGHPGEPLDVAYGVLYLASDEAKFVTGTDLTIDGGYTAQ